MNLFWFISQGNKNIVVNTEGEDSQKVTSLSTDSVSPSSSLMSLREDADSGNSASVYFTRVKIFYVVCEVN